MMKVAALAALAGSAAAFAPAQQARTSTSLSATAAQTDFFGLVENVDFSKELGVQPPVSAPARPMLLYEKRGLCGTSVIFKTGDIYRSETYTGPLLS